MSKILIVEDNVEIAELVRDLLIQEGFEAIICHDGYQGIEFTHKFQPDLILLDLMLPAGGGYYVLEKVRLSSHTKYTPIVVLTASKDKEQKKQVLEKGVEAYLEKPYDNQELISTIRNVLGQDQQETS